MSNNEDDMLKYGLEEVNPVEVAETTDITNLKDLVIYNDDFNTFDHVIKTLIKVCGHTPQQAEQCTWNIHHKGKCTVKKGLFEELKHMQEAICDAGIDARIL
jgi:ATP-dependent Clp protease adaptor protein ClpS